MSDVVSISPEFEVEVDSFGNSRRIGDSDLSPGENILSNLVRRFGMSKNKDIILVFEDDIVPDALIVSHGLYCIVFLPEWSCNGE